MVCHCEQMIYLILRFNLNRHEHTLVIKAHHTRSNLATDHVVRYYTQQLSNKIDMKRKILRSLSSSYIVNRSLYYIIIMDLQWRRTLVYVKGCEILQIINIDNYYIESNFRILNAIWPELMSQWFTTLVHEPSWSSYYIPWQLV